MDVSWKVLMADARKNGFEDIEERAFTVARFGEAYRPINFIAAHPSKFLLLHATSFLVGRREVINDAQIYGCVRKGNHSVETLARLLIDCKRGPIPGHQKVYFHLELGQKGLFEALQRINSKLTLCTWGNLHPTANISGYSHEEQASNAKRWQEFRTKLAPEWVREFINT